MSSGQYDQEYLDYLRALLESMGKAGLVAYVVSYLHTRSIETQPLVNTSRRLVPVLRRGRLSDPDAANTTDVLVWCPWLDPRSRRLRPVR
jgi:hypothetical protein